MTPAPLVEQPIFIVGPGRSGTTLLRSLLSAHSRISITPETQYMKWGSKRGDIRRAPEDFERFWSDYTSWVRFRDLDVDPERCHELIIQQGEATFESIFRAVLTAYKERVGKERVGEKSPSHVRFLSELLAWFPKGRVIIMQRDPRAVVASQLKTPYVREQLKPLSLRQGVFSGKRSHQIAHYATDWAEIYGEVVPAWRGDPRVRVVSYELLVQDTEAEIRALCDFLGESFEESMLTNRSSETVPMPAGKTPNEQLEKWRREHHAKSLGRVTPDSLDKWRHELSSTEVAIVEGRCPRGMRASGYAFSASLPKRMQGRLLSNTLLAVETSETRARKLLRSARGRIHHVGR